MLVKLVIVSGRASKGEVPLVLPAIIGRSQAAALTVAHALVSRQHCMIFEANGLAMVRDLESLNGTFVGREKITESPLLPGVLLTVGPLTFRVEYEPSQEALEALVSSEGAAEGPWAGTEGKPETDDSAPWESGGGELADDVFEFLDDPPAVPAQPATPGDTSEEAAPPLALPPKRVSPQEE